MKFTKTHVKALRKVRDALSWGTTMTGTTVVLSQKNQDKWRKAKQMIEEAANILESIE